MGSQLVAHVVVDHTGLDVDKVDRSFKPVREEIIPGERWSTNVLCKGDGERRYNAFYIKNELICGSLEAKAVNNAIQFDKDTGYAYWHSLFVLGPDMNDSEHLISTNETV